MKEIEVRPGQRGRRWLFFDGPVNLSVRGFKKFLRNSAREDEVPIRRELAQLVA